MTTSPYWQSQARPNENIGDAALRFVVEAFDADRLIIWAAEPGVFRFTDGYWHYRIEFSSGNWLVLRVEKLTHRADARAKARTGGSLS